MKRILLLSLLVFSVFSVVSIQNKAQAIHSEPSSTWWDVQAVDTMKDSRDMALAKKSDITYTSVIQQQMIAIKGIGATHVAIATPYDAEFIPFLTRWVTEARSVGLHVWFRGNFSGWETWFNYPRINREEHKQKLEHFILENPTLFEEGDIFTPCHECENGGPGDPRNTGDVAGFRTFMIDERNIAQAAFKKINKNVYAGYIPTNGDVARLVMDEETTRQLGGVVTVDHYVRTEKDMARDIDFLHQKTKGNIMIGEVGAPVPDIQGTFTPQQQAEWIDKTMRVLAANPAVIGVNYWTAMHGSTGIWNADGSPRPAVEVLKKYFRPQTVSVRVTNELAEPIADASVRTGRKEVQTDGTGTAIIPVLDAETTATVSATHYSDQTVMLLTNQSDQQVVLRAQQETFLTRLKRFLFKNAPFLFSKIPWIRS